MKDSQRGGGGAAAGGKYIKANNERFSTQLYSKVRLNISISRRIMKDSQQADVLDLDKAKYIKANNERFSTHAIACRQRE